MQENVGFKKVEKMNYKTIWTEQIQFFYYFYSIKALSNLNNNSINSKTLMRVNPKNKERAPPMLDRNALSPYFADSDIFWMLSVSKYMLT